MAGYKDQDFDPWDWLDLFMKESRYGTKVNKKDDIICRELHTMT